MKSILLMFTCLFCISSVFVNAGVRESFVYNKRNRYQLEALDGIVNIKVNAYYAFADRGLIRTVVEERKQIDSRKKRGRASITSVYSSIPGHNETLQMLRNSLWVIDAEITRVLSGALQTNRVFIAMRRTRAYDRQEYPSKILAKPIDSDVILGLVQLTEKEFKNSFNGLACYLRNDLGFLDINYTEDLTNRYLNEYDSVFRDFRPSLCYVAREIGTKKRIKFENGKKIEYREESGLMKEFIRRKREGIGSCAEGVGQRGSIK